MGLPTAAPAGDVPFSSNTKKENIMKQVAIHNASKVAAETKKAERITTPSGYAASMKAIIELEMMALAARLMLLKELSTMTDEEKMACLFQVLDKNRDGSLSTGELADGLRKIQGDVTFEESLDEAIQNMVCFDRNGDGKLQFSEFKEYLEKLAEAFGEGATFHNLAEMLILSVVFSTKGNDDEDNVRAVIADETITLALQEEEAMLKLMCDGRLEVLFHLFDLDADGLVDFNEVVMGLYKITENLDAAAMVAVASMMEFDENQDANFDYMEFSRFILEIIAGMGTPFNEAIYEMTKLVAKGEPDDTTMEELNLKLKNMLKEQNENTEEISFE